MGVKPKGDGRRGWRETEEGAEGEENALHSFLLKKKIGGRDQGERAWCPLCPSSRSHGRDGEATQVIFRDRLDTVAVVGE